MADLPQLPSPIAGLAQHIAQHPETSMIDIMRPYREYEAKLRTVYAQDRQNPLLADPYLNVLPLFAQDTKHITTRARNLEAESEEEKSKYVMALPEDKRRPHGSPATVANMTEFQNNFNVFSESSLVDMDWSNVVAAGSSVVNCLLPVPKEFTLTKRRLREYYHEKFCPASDVDLFLYGLNHDQAIEKIKQIERAIRDALLNEVTVVRTKYAITVASQYPVRHIQIVLRVYKSISEILTGFDIDAAGGAYDGKQVYVTPRALGSFITQINHVDLTRRSPSYENRLSKYSHRNFEIYWPELDRSRIDPTIFERSFRRTLGLARLLVLERLPTESARETYLNKRREERGRPKVFKYRQVLHGNIKDYHEYEVADWLSEEDVSNYHTFTVPYGQKFDAKRIEKLCYTRDLLLNAEWNQRDEREVYLHRHPAFFGRVIDVIEDCCGCCPIPKTDQEKEVAEKEAEIYISGKVSFLIDDPGRQQIGSFNPLTENDWTEMAYISDTGRLCQAIVDSDLDGVLNWLSEPDADPNKRDYTGRAPLHLAVMTSTLEIVKCLVDHGARLTARLADGKTALHLAATRGDTAMIKILMDKSVENEAMEEERKHKRRRPSDSMEVDEAQPKRHKSADAMDIDDQEPSSLNQKSASEIAQDANEQDEEGSDGELIDGGSTDNMSMTTGSFVKVGKEKGDEDAEDLPRDDEEEPDYYAIDVLAWDIPCSPLHLAITEGHEEAVKLLCNYGADSILPIKFFNKDNDSDTAAILTLVLALALPREKAKSMARLLLKLGATCSQADPKGCTVLHRFVKNDDVELVDLLINENVIGLKAAINHVVLAGWSWSPSAISVIHVAIAEGDVVMILRLLNAGAKAEIDFDAWLKANKDTSVYSNSGDLEASRYRYRGNVNQPLIAAIESWNPESAIILLENGADPNTLTPQTEQLIENEYQRSWRQGKSALDLVCDSIKTLSKYKGEKVGSAKPKKKAGMEEYLQKFQPDSYSHWLVTHGLKKEEESYEAKVKEYEKAVKRFEEMKGRSEKQTAIAEALNMLKKLEEAILSRGGKTFVELRPDIKCSGDRSSRHTSPSETPDEPYQYVFSFRGDNKMTEARRDGYIELMQAAWKGDVDGLRSLTLQAWGPEQDQPPLKMAISDGEGNTPFSLAFLRGHREVATAVLEIVKAQWSPEEKEKGRFIMKSDEDDNEDESDQDSENGSEDNEEPQIVYEVVKKQFTIDDIGQVSMEVKSHIKPHGFILRDTPVLNKDGTDIDPQISSSLFAHVVERDDAAGLKFLLDAAQHYASQKYEGDMVEEEDSHNFTIPQDVFRQAIGSGKSQMLSQLIKRTGAGIPLDHLVKKSGVEVKQKPRYYQGLTVYGKKRKDWATAGRNMVIRSTGMKTAPLLHAALEGSIESIEFFLGDAPHRLYSEFAKSKAGREDSRLKHLKEAPGGFDRAISKWLGADNDLVIHCAVLATPGPNANEVLEYLVDTCPSAIEKKNSDGESPLHVACRLGRTEFVKILISANADQSTHNSKNENIVHAVLSWGPPSGKLRGLLDCLDADLRSHLFLQRMSLQEDGNTPLHAWISRQKNIKSDGDEIAVLKLLLEYTKGAELEMLNGAGETCLHTLIRSQEYVLVEILITYRPQLLYRENAVGRTPAEVAHDSLISEKFERPRDLDTAGYGDKIESLLNLEPEYFVEVKDNTPKSFVAALKGDGSKRPKSERLWELCHATMEQHAEKRRLVSLNEANDVAKRLGERYAASRYANLQGRPENNDAGEAEEEAAESNDFVTQTLSYRRHDAWKSPDDDLPDI